MRLSKYCAGLIILSTLFSTGPANVASAGNSSEQRSGKATPHMSTKGSINTNAQWSADPEKGWVRADERRKQHEKGSTANGKQKGKGK
jgi:hypothetical protein